jgi:hypothetical protein
VTALGFPADAVMRGGGWGGRPSFSLRRRMVRSFVARNVAVQDLWSVEPAFG